MAAQLKMGSDRESRKRAWEENELSSLAKAIVKFPAGSQNRECGFVCVVCFFYYCDNGNPRLLMKKSWRRVFS